MLILSRMTGEKIKIGEDTLLEVLGIATDSLCDGVKIKLNDDIIYLPVGKVYEISKQIAFVPLRVYTKRATWVSFGIKAPKNIRVDREEIRNKIDLNKLNTEQLIKANDLFEPMPRSLCL